MLAGEIYIYAYNDDNGRLDTLYLKDGQFIYGGNADEVTPYILLFPNTMEQIVFIGPGQELNYTASSDNMRNYSIDEGEENALMARFRTELGNAAGAQARSIALKYIKENATSPVSVYLLDRYFVQSKDITIEELRKAYDIVSKEHPDSKLIMQLEADIKTFHALDKGKKMPDLKVRDHNGKETTLWKGKSSEYTLCIFWTTDCIGSYDIMNRMRQLAKDFPDRSKLRLVNISLDMDTDRWQERIHPDSTATVEHYCDGLGLASPMIRKTGPINVPLLVTCDSKHEIIETGVSGMVATDNLRKLLDKQHE